MNNKTKTPPYSYGYAKRIYKKLKGYEISTEIPEIKDGECLIIRLDGVGMTARFKRKNELFISDFHLAMKLVLENIKNYCTFIKFAYSFKDEISFLVDKEFIKTNKHYENRIEKILPIISGYVSAIFSQHISPELKTAPTEPFAFDARAIILPEDKLKDYFRARQAFAMVGFMDRLYSFYRLSIEKRTFANVNAALKEKEMNWYNFPQYVCNGYVGFGEEWKVETASDFSRNWENYNIEL